MNIVPATIGSLALAWFASQASARPSAAGWSKDMHLKVQYRDAALGTHGDLGATATKATIVPADTASLMNFYSDLAARQQDLGAEFETVLYDNLWDLYAR
ncbi:hypothetical protein M2232_001834 [Bradyrhizobium japonicum]|uniref:hypothetical protein n=1 Tax=Bradyrhizobium japonicum TaxID=375 RepID=UPI002227321D|nr:hypothetical protein [Bradyrhizobium japonicum]MCW2218302.1 hypothetical protein [Bradyrhizobium japonicum]MCW2342916.1 hypothetical protein [Bradyrhizobium japonicum]